MRSTGRRLVGGLAAFPSRLYGETASADGDLAETVVGGRCGAPPTQPHSQSLGKVTLARAHAPAPVVGTVTVCRGTVTVYGTRGGVGQVAGPVDGGRFAGSYNVVRVENVARLHGSGNGSTVHVAR